MVRPWLPVAAAALALLSLLLVPSFLGPDPSVAPNLEDIRQDEPRLREFLRTHPGHTEAGLLLAESILASPSAPVAALDEAWSLAPRSRTVRLGIARLLLERGHLREGVDRHRELLRESPDPEQALALASTLLDQELRRDAVGFLEDYLRDAPAAVRQAGALDLARLLWRLGRYEEMLSVLPAALPLERGKALARLGRRAEAHAALDEAEEILARDAAGRDQARLFKAELYLAAGAPQGEEILESLIRERSPLAPVAHLLRGKLSDFRIGLGALTGPALLHETGFDLARVQAALRQADPQEAVPVAREIVRLFPRSRTALTDLARLLLRAGLHAEAAERHLEAADDESVREAAAACFEGGLHLRAAALFRRVSDSFREAESLRRAGAYDEALSVFAQFAAGARRDDPRFAEALILRGRMLAGMGRRDEALAEFDRVVRAEEVETDPRKPEWCEALLERGLVLLEIAGREAEGKKSLDELFERTAGDPARRPLATRAAFELARRAVAERDWTGALGRLRAVERLGEHREARFLLGDVLLVRGEYEEAARVFGGAVEAYAGAEDRLRGLLGRARAQARLGRKDEAKRDLELGRALHAGARESIAATWASALDSLGSELQ